MNIFESVNALLLEFSQQSLSGIDKISFNKISLTEGSVKIKDGVIFIKAEFQYAFPNPNKIGSQDIRDSDIRDTVKSKIVPSKKFRDAFKDYLYETYSWLNKNNRKEKDMYNVEMDERPFETAIKLNENDNKYYCYTSGFVTFDMAEWWAQSIIDGNTDKSLFFKDYKIKYSWDVNSLVKKLANWKDKAIECLRYALFNKSSLKDHMRSLTKLPMDPVKVDFDISFNDARNEIKLVLLRGIVKWLKKFGISGSFSKWVITGLSLYAILKLVKDKDEDEWRKAKNKIDNFMD